MGMTADRGSIRARAVKSRCAKKSAIRRIENENRNADRAAAALPQSAGYCGGAAAIRGGRAGGRRGVSAASGGDTSRGVDERSEHGHRLCTLLERARKTRRVAMEQRGAGKRCAVCG